MIEAKRYEYVRSHVLLSERYTITIKYREGNDRGGLTLLIRETIKFHEVKVNSRPFSQYI